MTWIGVPAAAQQLALSPARVRELIGEGTVGARKVGSGWELHVDEVARLEQQFRPVGRPLTADHAWGILALLEQRRLPAGIDRFGRSRLRRRLREQPLGATVGRLRSRGVRQLWRGPVGRVEELVVGGDVVFGGGWTPHAAELGLVGGGPVELYLPEWAVGGFEEAGFVRVGGGGEVVTFVVPGLLWPYRQEVCSVGPAVAGVDLVEWGGGGRQAVGWQLLGAARAAAVV